MRHLQAAPLVLVLCEIRFAPVLTIESKVPAIQDKLRMNGFPGFEQREEHTFEINPSVAPKLTSQIRWIFRSLDSETAITLTASSLTLQVEAYTRFEDFLDALRPLVETVADAISPAYHERIGMRYVNAVEAAGDRVTELFRENVLSFSPEELGVDSLLTTQQVVGKTPAGHINVRMSQLEDTPLLPPDLLSLVAPEMARPRAGIHAILDIDGVDLTRGEFDVAQIEERLWNIHDYTERAFWKSTTEKAHKEWGMIGEEADLG